MPKQDVHAERAARLLDELRRQRELASHYPLSVSRLRELADPTATDEEVLQALRHKSIATAILLGGKKDLASPIALAEDLDALASSGVLLEYALGKLATAEKPVHPAAKVVGKVEKALQPAFQAALEQRLTESNLPPGIGRIEGKPILFLERFPPPPPPLPKRSPAMELAETLLQGLELRQREGQAIVTLAELVGDANPGLVKKAVACDPFSSEAVVVTVSKTVSLVALARERDALLTSDRLLVELLSARTSVKKPFVSLEDLATALPDAYRPYFLASRPLPSTVVERIEGDRRLVGLRVNVPATMQLTELVVAALTGRRERGEGYPVSLATLVPGTEGETLGKLLTDKTFRTRVTPAAPDLEAPAVLAGDEQQLADSPAVLEYALGKVSTAESPLQPVKKVVAVVDKVVRPAFEEAITRLLAEGQVPATIAVHTVKDKPHLRLARFELPKPAEEVLAHRLVELLDRARRMQAGYPTTLVELVQQAGHLPGEKVVKSALSAEKFTTQVVVAIPKSPHSLVAMTGDEDRLAGDARLIETLLREARSEDNQALPASDLGKKLAPALKSTFVETAQKRAEEKSLPAGVGCLVIKKKPHLFLLADAGVESAPKPSAPAAPRTIDFGKMFDDAFRKLDASGHNQVSLVRLREELPVERDTFDRELDALRRSGRYTLQGAEGRHGLSPEERAAGIEEYGQLLLYVSRRD